MKKLFIPLMILTALLPGCSQGPSPEEISKVAYEWEKAVFDRDYDRQQVFLYEEGSYEAYKGDKRIDSGLKYEDIRFEVYHDKELDNYYVLADFKNPNGKNTVKDELLIRKKDDTWKIDQNKSMKLDRDQIEENFERQACIHCDQ
ncbi:hypothetical protein [Ammoniphilus sp. 3BR4]|uniref:hypothetical protein n=1 Tax=Ammoniphilus sp. 3BR4 TaxID=3158265 RepID=UPI003465AF4C